MNREPHRFSAWGIARYRPGRRSWDGECVITTTTEETNLAITERFADTVAGLAGEDYQITDLPDGNVKISGLTKKGYEPVTGMFDRLNHGNGK